MTLIKVRGYREKNLLNHSFSSIAKTNTWLAHTEQEDQPKSSTQKASFQKLQGTLNSEEISQPSSKSPAFVSSQKPNKNSLISGKQQAPSQSLTHRNNSYSGMWNHSTATDYASNQRCCKCILARDAVVQAKCTVETKRET